MALPQRRQPLAEQAALGGPTNQRPSGCPGRAQATGTEDGDRLGHALHSPRRQRLEGELGFCRLPGRGIADDLIRGRLHEAGARFTTLPIMVYSRRRLLPTVPQNARPVAIPMAWRTPRWRSCAWMPSPARTARTGSSSWATGGRPKAVTIVAPLSSTPSLLSEPSYSYKRRLDVADQGVGLPQPPRGEVVKLREPQEQHAEMAQLRQPGALAGDESGQDRSRAHSLAAPPRPPAGQKRLQRRDCSG